MESGSGVVISSQSGHRLPAATIEQNKALALTPADELLQLPFLQRDQIKDSLRLSAVEARKLIACHGRSGALGQARRAHQHDQPGNHHDPGWRRTNSRDRVAKGTAA